MKKLIQFLGSLKLSVIVLVAIVIALASATIVESMKGTPAAWTAFYGAFWFRALFALFALNVAMSMVDRWPWGWARTGFALTHGSMLLILAGALVTDQFKTEGKLSLWQGEESGLVTASRSAGETGSPEGFSLPFSVRLDSFEIDTYPGTHRPAMFRSRVTVNDPASGGSFPAVIQMNQELSHAGWKLFQSSYQIEGDRRQTVLSVSRDPGQPVVFLGYILLLAGMCTVFATRIAQRRALLAHMTEDPPLASRSRGRVLVATLGCLLAALGATSRAATLVDADAVRQLRLLPVQHDGRVMPLDTLAREAVWNVTGRHGWQGTDSVALVLGWVYHSEEWSNEPIVKIGEADLASEIGLPGRGSASLRELLASVRFRELAAAGHEAEEAERPVGGLPKKALKLEERLVWLHGLLDGSTLRVAADPSDSNAEWQALSPNEKPADLIAFKSRPSPGAYPPAAAMQRETRYNAVRPTRLAWWILSASLVVSILAWVRPRRLFDGLAVAGLAGGFLTMTWGIVTRWQVAGRIPAANMYESMLFLGWGVGLFAFVAFIFLRNRLVILNATAMAALAMILADRLPIDPFIHPVPPVLAGTAWLAIHVPIIMVSYSVLALGVLIAHMQIGCTIFAPARKDLAIRMNDLLYWYTHVGSILLIAGILTGSVWAASSWGRYWGWDPKEVWSLVAFLAYLAILHGRFDRLIGPFGVAALSIIAFGMIVMTYVGVNFVLASGLHSYGFGSSAVVRWLVIAAGAEALFLSIGLWSYLAHRPAAFARSAEA